MIDPRKGPGLGALVALGFTTLALASGASGHMMPGRHSHAKEPGDTDLAGRTARSTVERFHSALAAGNRDAAAALLARDAVVLEDGAVESLDRYLADHLSRDIDFARRFRIAREVAQVSSAGEVAWVALRSTASGRPQGKEISVQGAELLVLSKLGGRWTIRAIHRSTPSAPR